MQVTVSQLEPGDLLGNYCGYPLGAVFAVDPATARVTFVKEGATYSLVFSSPDEQVIIRRTGVKPAAQVA